MFRKSFTEVSQREAKTVQAPMDDLYAVEVRLPRNSNAPATVETFTRSILELQSTFLGTRNASPIVTYELQRPRPEELQLQFLVSTKRVERKIRTQLSNQVNGIGFEQGETELPVEAGDTLGGGFLTLGRKDRFPLRTEFESPPLNSVVASLHRHAMTDSKIVIQIVFQPVSSEPVRERLRKHRSYQTVGFLRKEKESLWSSRSPTPRERKQADAVERKMGTRRYWVSIRFLVLNAGKFTPSRVKELAAGFNSFENGDTGQYLDIHTLRSARRKHFIKFLNAVKRRKFNGYSLKFQASVEELAALLSIPDRSQQNLRMAEP
jgi:hypothetical protein